MTQVPLCGHAALSSTLVWRANGPRSVAQWLADVQRVAARWPQGARHVLNTCEDRYHFLVVFAAGILRGAVSLQPPSLAAPVLHAMQQRFEGMCCIHDASPPPGLPCAAWDVRTALEDAAAPDALAQMPLIACEQVVSLVFTSGSTGEPLPHAKTWGRLWRNARAEYRELGLHEAPAQVAIVGTVPSQHMYGFESVMLLALLGGCSLWAGKPLFAADVAAALAAVPAPRMLVSTPVHLRALACAGQPFVPLHRVLCATAPLSNELAQHVETALGAPLCEIYGCTESGQIASRRTLDGPAWRLFADVRLDVAPESAQVSGGHVEGRVALGDVIEALDARHFVLHGRKSDMINIAGKRSSLAFLNAQLHHIEGLRDGAFFLPRLPDGSEAARLCLVAHAPEMDAGALMAALRARIDDVFLPRPLIVVSAMPRNDTGKLPLRALQALFEQHMAAKPQRWHVPLQHPAFAGHFPGHPVLPGAVLLQRAADLWQARRGSGFVPCRMASAKFFATCHGGDVLDFEVQDGGAWRVLRGEAVVAAGRIQALEP